MKTATAILVLLAMFVVAGTTSAQDNDKVLREEICEEFWNPCCEEDVWICVDMMVVLDKDGDFKHISYNGVGTGLLTGTEYTVKAVGNSHMNNLDQGSANFQMVVTFKMIATDDSDCSFTMRRVAHLTLKPDGTLAVEFERELIECGDGTVIE